MGKQSRFTQGSGCYRCYACKRLTRDTGHDGVACGLCEECNEVALLVNAISDNGDPDGKYLAELRAWEKQCAAKGGVFKPYVEEKES